MNPVSYFESARLAALNSYNVLDSSPEEDYDAITRIAAQICKMPISAVTLVDQDRQWFKSSIGLPNRETPRTQSFCSYAIEQPNELMEVQDSLSDERFRHNPLATGEPHVIYYAGVPLVDEDGFALGALCVIDNKPNQLTDEQKDSLKLLARQVVALLTLRRNKAQLEVANTQLQSVNQKMQESNAILQAVVDNCPAGLVLFQAVRENERIVDFEYVLTNPLNASITGLSVAEMTGSSLKTLFPNTANSPFFDRLVEVVETGLPYHYEAHHQLDSIDIWGNFSATPLGEKLLFTVQDITRLKENEEKLRTDSENLEQLVAERTAEISQLSALQNAIVEHAGLAIISTDPTGTIRTVNPATQHLFGYATHELVGKRDVLFLYDQAALIALAQQVGELMGRPIPVDFELFKLTLDERGYEFTMRRKDGRRMPTFLVSSPLRDKSKAVIGYVIMVTDISALRTARDELSKKNQELNTFFEMALDLHCIATIDGTVLKLNRAWQTTLGYSTTELLTVNYFDLIHPDDLEGTRTVIEETARYQTSVKSINRFRHRNGEYRLIEWNVVAINSMLYASARDITEYHRAETKLRKTNQRLQLATQVASLGIWDYNIERDEIRWDDTMYAIFGIANDGTPLRLKDYQKLLGVDELPGFEPRHKRSDNTLRTNEQRIVRPDGSVRWIELHGASINNKAGQVMGSVGVVQDITERKRAEWAMRASEERYRLLVENLNEVVYQTNLNRELVFLNPYWTTMTGYTVAESLGQPSSKYYALPIDQTASQNAFDELINQQVTAARLEIGYQHKNGEHRWAEIFAQVMLDSEGKSTGLTGTITDITERRQALNALRQSEQRFRDIAENINEIFWIHSIEPFQLLYINPAYQTVTGLSPQPLYDNPLAFLDMVLPDERAVLEEAFQKYAQGQEIHVAYRAKNAQKEVRWFEIKTFVKRDRAGQPLNYIGIATDITNQKERELVLQQSLLKEQELNRLKSQFVSTASHEFRTPLATIQSSVDLIKLYVDQPPEQTKTAIQRHLGVIQKEITNFSSLLSDVLTFGKIEAGKIAFNPKPTDMVELVEDIVSTHFNERIDHRTVQVLVEHPPRLIKADTKLFSHVLINLLSNAFKFSNTDPTLKLIFETNQFRVIVADTGIGIPANEQAHLFDTFFRASNVVNIQGSGLGLVIARQFVQLHGGEIEVCSQENVGTTFTITLPL